MPVSNRQMKSMETAGIEERKYERRNQNAEDEIRCHRIPAICLRITCCLMAAMCWVCWVYNGKCKRRTNNERNLRDPRCCVLSQMACFAAGINMPDEAGWCQLKKEGGVKQYQSKAVKNKVSAVMRPSNKLQCRKPWPPFKSNRCLCRWYVGDYEAIKPW